jgi:hypothetical protein
MPIASTTAVPLELANTLCPNCGYALEGLASSGKCPECGRVQNPSEVVLYGWTRGQFENTGNSKPSRFLWAVVFAYGWILNLGSWGFRTIALAGAIAMILSVLTLIRRKDSRHPGLIQVRLTPQGCVQLNDTSALSPFRELVVHCS